MTHKKDTVDVWGLARDIPLQQVVESLYVGANRVRDSVGRTGAKEAWKYSLSQGDPLKVADQSFSFLSREVHGGGAINLYCELCGTTPEVAVEELVRDFLPTVQLNGSIKAPKKSAPPAPTGPVIPEKPAEPQRDFPLPPVSLMHLDKARAFLTEDRGLSPDLVDAAIESRKFYPAVIWKKNPKFGKERPGDKKQYEHYKFLNLIQPVTSFTTGKPIGTSNRSLTQNSKINEGDKQCGAFLITPFTEDTKRVVLTESPIESLSYVQMKNPDDDTCVIGQSGTSVPEWFLYKAGKQGCTIQTSLNNDIAGRKAAGKTQKFCKDHGFEYEQVIPEAGEIHLAMEDTERHQKMITKLIEVSEKEDIALKCESSDRGGYLLKVENTTAVCREIYKTELKDKEESRDINRQRRFDFRVKDRTAPFPTTPDFSHKPAQLDISYVCTDWNDMVKGAEGRELVGPDRVRQYPDEFKKTPSMEAKEGAKKPKAPEMDM